MCVVPSRKRPSRLWVTNDKTHLEYNESALTLKADLAADINDAGRKERATASEPGRRLTARGAFASNSP